MSVTRPLRHGQGSFQLPWARRASTHLDERRPDGMCGCRAIWCPRRAASLLPRPRGEPGRGWKQPSRRYPPPRASGREKELPARPEAPARPRPLTEGESAALARHGTARHFARTTMRQSPPFWPRMWSLDDAEHAVRAPHRARPKDRRVAGRNAPRKAVTGTSAGDGPPGGARNPPGPTGAGAPPGPGARAPADLLRATRAACLTAIANSCAYVNWPAARGGTAPTSRLHATTLGRRARPRRHVGTTPWCTPRPCWDRRCSGHPARDA